jgi:hypothetical protein
VPALPSRAGRPERFFRSPFESTYTPSVAYPRAGYNRLALALSALSALAVDGSAVLVALVGADVDLVHRELQIRLLGVNHVPERQLGGIDSSGSVEIAENHFDLCRLGHAVYCMRRGGAEVLPPGGPPGQSNSAESAPNGPSGGLPLKKPRKIAIFSAFPLYTRGPIPYDAVSTSAVYRSIHAGSATFERENRISKENYGS